MVPISAPLIISFPIKKLRNMISIIIPVYNVQAYLDECVCSVVEQSYRDLEIILVDDGSTDNSGRMCDGWAEKDRRIRVVHKPNGGLSSARNAGLDAAKGDYIAFVDSDDFVDKTMFSSLLKAFDEKMDVGVVCCGISQFKDEDYLDTNPFLKLYNRKFTLLEYWRLILKHKIDNAVWNKIYRRNVIENVRFREGVINEDILFNLEVLQNVSFLIYVPDTYYKYRIRAGSITRQANPRLFDFIDNAFFLKKVLLEEMKFPLTAEMEAYIYHEMTNCISTVEKYHSADKYREQKKYCKKYILNHPVRSFGNCHWSIKQKVKFFLVSYFPSFYRFMLKI